MITFKSRAAASVMMFDDVAHHLLDIMGKTPEPQGIITLEQLPGAIARLESAATADRAAQRAQPEDDEEKPEGPRPIGFSQRAVPLIELLQISLRAKEPVIWGK